MRDPSVIPSPRLRSPAIDLGTKTYMSFMNSQGGKLVGSRSTVIVLSSFSCWRAISITALGPDIVDAQKSFLRDTFAKDEMGDAANTCGAR